MAILGREERAIFCVFCSLFVCDLANTGRGSPDTRRVKGVAWTSLKHAIFLPRGAPLARMGEWGQPQGYASTSAWTPSAEQVTNTKQAKTLWGFKGNYIKTMVYWYYYKRGVKNGKFGHPYGQDWADFSHVRLREWTQRHPTVTPKPQIQKPEYRRYPF